MGCVYLATQTASETRGFVRGDCYYRTARCVTFFVLLWLSKGAQCITGGIIHPPCLRSYSPVCLFVLFPALICCVLLMTGASAQDVTGEPEAESYGGGVLPESETVRHGGKTDPWG